ncbi:MAG TPA: hypothetical protein VMU45_02185 [Candidatus Eisenbacteria bacterium]|nr:hypothetical protein [Candidatus Eisenbacteria bacterium]
MNERPISVTILGYLLIAMGTIGIAYHFAEFKSSRLDEYIWVLLVRLTAIVCGVFLLRGSDWARWVAMAWIAFHVVISYFHSMQEVAFHAVVLVAFAVVLFRAAANRYFRGHAPESGSKLR